MIANGVVVPRRDRGNTVARADFKSDIEQLIEEISADAELLDIAPKRKPGGWPTTEATQ